MRYAVWGLLTALAACDAFEREPDDRPTGDAGAVVTMSAAHRFVPQRVVVAVGQAVQWRNTDGLEHTVTCDPALARDRGSARLPAGARTFHSGALPPGDAFSHTFRVPGTYRYFCLIHERDGMVGEVVVEGGALGALD